MHTKRSRNLTNGKLPELASGYFRRSNMAKLTVSVCSCCRKSENPSEECNYKSRAGVRISKTNPAEKGLTQTKESSIAFFITHSFLCYHLKPPLAFGSALAFLIFSIPIVPIYPHFLLVMRVIITLWLLVALISGHSLAIDAGHTSLWKPPSIDLGNPGEYLDRTLNSGRTQRFINFANCCIQVGTHPISSHLHPACLTSCLANLVLAEIGRGSRRL